MLLKKKRKCFYCKRVLHTTRGRYCDDDCRRGAAKRKKAFAIAIPGEDRGVSRKVLIKRLDAQTSRITIARDKVCVQCGSSSQPTDGHVFGRSHQVLRWDIRPDGNNHQQCWPCNVKHKYDTVPYNMWYIEKFGLARFNELYTQWHNTVDFSDADLLDMYNKLKEIK